MKKVLIRSLALLLTAVLVFGVSPLVALSEIDFGVTAAADSNGIFNYELKDGNATITGYNDSSEEVTIPATLGGYPVTAIGDSAFADCSFTSITIPAGVTSIGSSAFEDCPLTSVTLNVDSAYELKSLQPWEPNLTKDITAIKLAPGVEFTNSSGKDMKVVTVFGGDVTVSNGTSYAYTNESTTINGVVYKVDTTTTPNTAYVSGKDGSPVNVTIESTVKINGSTYDVTSIGDSAFLGCSELASVTFAKGSKLESIGEDAFRNCTALKSIELPSGVTSIGTYAFYICTALKSMELPSSVKTIGSNAFYACPLTSITLNVVDDYELKSLQPWEPNLTKDITAIKLAPDVTFTNSFGKDMKVVTISGETVTVSNGASYGYTILDGIIYAFYGTTAYVSGFDGVPIKVTIESTVTIGGSTYDVTSIGEEAFAGCTSLKSVAFASGSKLKSIGDWAFQSCTSLKNVTFASGSKLESIGGHAFYGCSSLTGIELPAGVKIIGGYAFCGCTSLKFVHIPASVEKIGDGILDDNTEAYICSETEDCYAKTYADDNKKIFIPCNASNGHCPTCSKPYGEWVSNNNITHTRTCTGGHTQTANCTGEPIGEAVAATCTATGLTAGLKCSVCEYVIFAQTEIPLAKHTAEKTDAVAATCTEKGLTEGSRCSVCKENIITQVEISARGHAYGNWAASSGGTHTRTCSLCAEGEEGHSETVACTAVTDAAAASTCTAAGLTEGSHCPTCLRVFAAQTILPALGHTPGEWTVDTPARTDAAGSRRAQCTVCGATLTQPIPALVAVVEIFETEGTVEFGETIKIDAETPNIAGYSVKWESSDPSIATVDQSGNVTGTGRGGAIITATLIDANGNAAKDTNGNEIKDEIKITATMTFWQIIIEFFRDLIMKIFSAIC